MLDYIDSIEEAGYDCDATMLDHFIAIVKAYQKNLEINNGEVKRCLRFDILNLLCYKSKLSWSTTT